MSERFNVKNDDIRFSVRDTEKLTKEQYNTWGWAREAGVVSAKEMDTLHSLVVRAKTGEKNTRAVSKDGLDILAFGAENGIDNVVTVLKMNLVNPAIQRVYRIENDNENYNEIVREMIYEYERTYGNAASKIIATVFGEEYVSGWSFEGAPTYQAYRQEGHNQTGRSGKGTQRSNQGLQNGRGSVENRGGSGSVEDSGVMRSLRSNETVSDREIVAEADFNVAGTPAEKEFLTKYKDMFEKLNKANASVREQTEIFDNPKSDIEKQRAGNRLAVLMEPAARTEDKILHLENTKLCKDMLGAEKGRAYSEGYGEGMLPRKRAVFRDLLQGEHETLGQLPLFLI